MFGLHYADDQIVVDQLRKISTLPLAAYHKRGQEEKHKMFTY